MSSLTDIKNSLSSLKPKLATDFAVERIGIFGSYARNEQTDESDIDILVEFNRPVGYEFFKLQRFLEKYLGKKIDLTTKAMLKARIREEILSETNFV